MNFCKRFRPTVGLALLLASVPLGIAFLATGCSKPSPEVCEQEKDHGMRFAIDCFNDRNSQNAEKREKLRTLNRKAESHRDSYRAFTRAEIKKRNARTNAQLKDAPEEKSE